MKKISILFAILIVTIGLVACSSDEEDTVKVVEVPDKTIHMVEGIILEANYYEDNSALLIEQKNGTRIIVVLDENFTFAPRVDTNLTNGGLIKIETNGIVQESDPARTTGLYIIFNEPVIEVVTNPASVVQGVIVETLVHNPNTLYLEQIDGTLISVELASNLSFAEGVDTDLAYGNFVKIETNSGFNVLVNEPPKID